MSWDKIKGNYRSFVIRDRDAEAILRGVEEFWRLFAEDVLFVSASEAWDYLLIDVRGIDDGMGIYPQHSKRLPFQVPWANLSIHQMGDDYREITETDEDGTKASLLDQHYARIIVEAAKRVNLAKLAQRRDGVLLQFLSYAETKLPPFLTELIMQR